MEGIREAIVTSNLPPGSEFFDSILDAWDNGQDIVFRHAPHILIVSSPDYVPSPEPDAVIALSYFELLAQSVGLGTTWCNLAEWAVASIIPDMKRKLNIPRLDYLFFETKQEGLIQMNTNTHLNAGAREPGRISRYLPQRNSSVLLPSISRKSLFKWCAITAGIRTGAWVNVKRESRLL
jgi:hypothetical protein